MKQLKKILEIEKAKMTEEAIILIAKAAEGSVRDSLSLLDRAIISQNINEKEINEKSIRQMLGIADKSKILNLLKFILEGEKKKSIEMLREMINEGIQPTNFLNDLLEIIYFIQQKKSLGNFDSELSISESEQDIISSISSSIKMETLIVFWQFILKVMEEFSIVSNPILSLEMLIVRLIHLKDMPSYENLLNSLTENNLTSPTNNTTIELNKNKITNDEEQSTKQSKNQIKNTIQIKPIISSEPKNLSESLNKEKVLSFEDLIHLASKKREIQLKYDLEKNVNLIKFSEGKIDISFNQKLDKNFVRNLSTKLVEWTGNRWVITLSKETGNKTFAENKVIKKNELINKEKKNEIYKKFKNVFSDIELMDILKKD